MPENRMIRLLSSSVGRKVQMAATGLLLCGFLVVHLAGNLYLYQGEEAYNHYVRVLTENPLVPLAELGLLALFLVHVLTAIIVHRDNRRARPVPYAATAWAGGKTVASTTMIASGLLLLGFLVIHVKTFRFGETGDNLYRMVTGSLGLRRVAVFYLVSMASLGLHLSHGFQSAFQTLGVNHPRVTPFIRLAGKVFAAAMAAGFASLAVWAGFLR